MTVVATFRAICALTAAGVIAAGTSALAGPCSYDLYWLNGSLLELSVCAGRPVRLTYQKPQEGLERHGVKVGSIFFIGARNQFGRLSGTAWIFKRGCGNIGFIVRGRMDKDRIALKGRAPVRNGNCVIVRTREQELLFERAAATP